MSEEPIKFSTIDYDYLKIPDKSQKDGKIRSIPIIVFKPKTYIIVYYRYFNLCIIYSHGNSCDMGISFYECVDIALNTNVIFLNI